MRSHRHPATLAVASFVVIVSAAACSSGQATRPSRPPGPEALDTAAIANVDGKSWEDIFATRFPGVMVSRTDNGALQIRIRGGSNSFFAGEEPLYVVDGTPLPDGSRGIVFLSPYDIERIEVLKNPDETAIYGIRGSNGVVKVTTKRPGRR